MENIHPNNQSLDHRIAEHLKLLRTQQGWSLDELSKRCGISRATLSRLENSEVSATASVLGKLCSTYNLSVSRLMAIAETDFSPLHTLEQQEIWEDRETGFKRRSVSPPTKNLSAEILHCELPPATRIEYADTPKPGLEHHIFVLNGALEMTVEGQSYLLREGDCLRYRLYGSSSFVTKRDEGAAYLLVIV